VRTRSCADPKRAALVARRGQRYPRRFIVLYTLVVVLLVLWLLGLVTSFTAGGLLHILLVAAVVVLIYQLVTGRRGI
jgi:hypothetical protein